MLFFTPSFQKKGGWEKKKGGGGEVCEKFEKQLRDWAHKNLSQNNFVGLYAKSAK